MDRYRVSGCFDTLNLENVGNRYCEDNAMHVIIIYEAYF